jgi:pyruvate, water dikinase
MAAHDLVRDLAEVGTDDRAVVGGKAAGLGELLRAGIPVPPGFVVTAQAFERALAGLDPRGEIRREIGLLAAADTAVIARLAGQVRARITAAPLPPVIQGEITARYRVLGAGPGAGEGSEPTGRDGGEPTIRVDGGGQPTGPDGGEPTVRVDGGDERSRSGAASVAVRSSATGEDSAEASFAGLQDTYLWVAGADAVAEHVRRCWASLYNAEAVSYRRRMNLAEQGLAMAVVVQQMVEPRCAGVMFTRSPATGDRSVIAVEGSWGLGSAMVSGEVTPDSFAVSKVTGEIIRRAVAAKLRMHLRDPSGEGVSEADVPEHLQDVPCLRDAEIAALAQLGRRISSGRSPATADRAAASSCCRAGRRRYGPAAPPRLLPRRGRVPLTTSSSSSGVSAG